MTTDPSNKQLAGRRHARTKPVPARHSNHNFLAGGGQCGEQIRSIDWSASPLGEPDSWPQSLKTAVRIILTSRQPMFVWWGKELINLYNDAYREIVGDKHPRAMGQPASEVWREIWDQVGPRARQAMRDNVGTYDEALLLIMQRHGYPEETYYTFSYSPIPGDSGKAEGIICANSDDTGRIVGERQLATLKELAAQISKAHNVAQACRLAAKALTINNRDMPFAAVYANEPGYGRLRLAGTAGISKRHVAIPPTIDLRTGYSGVWPFAEAIRTGKPKLVRNINEQFERLPAGGWDVAPTHGVVVPFGRRDSEGATGLMIVGLNPYRPYGEDYESFIKLVASEISTGVTNAKAYESERRQLMANEERFRTLIEQSGDALQLLAADGSSIYASDSVQSVVGYTPHELQGMTIDPYIYPEDRQPFMAAWRRVLRRQGNTATLQYRVRHKDGQWVWLETTMSNHLKTPNIEAVVGNFRNITVRKQFEEQLRASERRFRFMAESMPQKIFTMQPDGFVSYFNPQWEAYTGIASEALSHDGSVWRKLVHPDDNAALVKVWQAALRTPRQTEYEFRMLRHDGAYRWHFGRMRPMQNEDGEVIVWIGSVTDIHDMKLATERRHELEIRTTTLTEQKAQLMALNQAKDEFISLASHQLRTPATGVKQYLGMLLEGYAGPLTQDQKNFLETAYESNERQINIVNDLLQVARIDAGKIVLRHKKTDLVRLVKNVINEHVSRFNEREQTVTLKARDEAVEITLDPDRVRMVLDNIIDNASKYTTSGKRITISIGRHAGSAYVSVADEGVGMAAADIEKIFQKFSRLENPHAKAVEGSGLGLYWAQKIIDLHGGTIKVKSKVGEGTMFTIELPL